MKSGQLSACAGETGNCHASGTTAPQRNANTMKFAQMCAVNLKRVAQAALKQERGVVMTFDDIPGVARTLLDSHGLRDWRFAWDNAKRRAGQCRPASKTITLSRHYVRLNLETSFDDVVDTILHEIAHALAGCEHGHNDVWKRKAAEIGARPERCLQAEKVTMPAGKYAATCGGCRKQYTCHKLPRKGMYRFCRACGKEAGKLHYVDTRTATIAPQVTIVPPTPKRMRGV